MSIYTEAKTLGIPMDSHESDLYLLVTPESRELVMRHARTFTTFVSQVDGRLWYDVPFAYTPWWEARAPRFVPAS